MEALIIPAATFVCAGIGAVVGFGSDTGGDDLGIGAAFGMLGGAIVGGAIGLIGSSLVLAFA